MFINIVESGFTVTFSKMREITTQESLIFNELIHARRILTSSIFNSFNPFVRTMENP